VINSNLGPILHRLATNNVHPRQTTTDDNRAKAWAAQTGTVQFISVQCISVTLYTPYLVNKGMQRS